MDYCNKSPTHIKVETPLGTYDNGMEDKIDWSNSNESVIGMVFIWDET